MTRRRSAFSTVLAASTIVATLGTRAEAQTPPEPDRVLRVGLKDAPPFVIKNDQGAWSGLAVDLWRLVAADLGLRFELEEHGLAELLGAVEAGEVDVAVGAITVTTEREARFDFTHPFFTSGIGAAARVGDAGTARLLRRLVSMDFLKALAALCAVLVLAGVAVWAFERRHNAAQFGGSPATGLGSGFWWAAVTMTTVGYGDKAPLTLGGRIAALIWMFASIITISGFTAAIASTLTTSSLESTLRSAGDLARVRVGALRDTVGTETLAARGIVSTPYDGLAPAFDALVAGSIDAVVHDRPLLIHDARLHPGEVEVMHWSLAHQYYALALPPQSPLRERLNGALLRVLSSPAWDDIRVRYLGEGHGQW